MSNLNFSKRLLLAIYAIILEIFFICFASYAVTGAIIGLGLIFGAIIGSAFAAIFFFVTIQAGYWVFTGQSFFDI